MPSISLPEVLDRTTVPAVSAAILAGRQSDLTIEAGNVRRVSGLGVEMLLSARRQWVEDGQSLMLGSISDTFAEALEQLGLAPEMLSTEVAA